MVYEYTCTICGEAGHTVGRCDELWQNKVPPPERGHGDDEEDAINLLALLGNIGYISRSIRLVVI